MTPKLQDSWEDPFVVHKKFNGVNYLIEEEDGRHIKKVVPINSLRKGIGSFSINSYCRGSGFE